MAWKSVVPHVETAVPEMALEAMDPGRERISTKPAEVRAFKTPTLRDLTRRGPYMHDGSLATLEEVVLHYARGGSNDPRLDRRIERLDLDRQEILDLVAFLESLTGEVRPGLASTVWKPHADRTELRFVDATGVPMVGLDVTLLPAGDTLPGDMPRTSPVQHLETDGSGRIEYAPPFRTHVRLMLPDDLPITGGTHVPDTCRKADIVVPIRGRTYVVVTFPAGTHGPERLVAEHVTEMALPEARTPRTVFHREHAGEVGGRQVVRYGAWFRTDVPETVRLRLPGSGRFAAPRLRLAQNDTLQVKVD
ncbi:MAG: cytochrome-c peroxidase [Planctomycetota bacterium]